MPEMPEFKNEHERALFILGAFWGMTASRNEMEKRKEIKAVMYLNLHINLFREKYGKGDTA